MIFLRKLFGPIRREIWQALSEELGAEFIEGGFWKRDKVEVSHGEWLITLDTYFCSASKCDYTRLQAPYVNPDGFRFTIYRRGFFSDIAKSFGMQDVEVGHPQFDHDFIIKGTDESKLRALFSNPIIRELIEAQPKVHFAVAEGKGAYRPGFPEETDTLTFHVAGVIKDQERLKQLFELFAETLDQLCRIGSAYEGAVEIEGADSTT